MVIHVLVDLTVYFSYSRTQGYVFAYLVKKKWYSLSYSMIISLCEYLGRKSDACYLTVGSRGRVVPLGASQFGLVIHPARIRCHTDILSHSSG